MRGTENENKSSGKRGNDEWREKYMYLMDYHACREAQGEKSVFMIYMLCEQQLTCLKLDTIKKHISRKHQDLSLYSDAKKASYF